MRKLLCTCILLAAHSTTVSAEVQKITENLYAGIGDNAILLLLLTQAGQILWYFGSWIVDKYFREQEDKDREVKQLKAEFNEFKTEITKGFSLLHNDMKHLSQLPDEDEILKKLSDRMEFMVYKAARDLGIKETKR